MACTCSLCLWFPIAVRTSELFQQGSNRRERLPNVRHLPRAVRERQQKNRISAGSPTDAVPSFEPRAIRVVAGRVAGASGCPVVPLKASP